MNREVPDGGTVSLAGGGDVFSNCAGDVIFDVEHSTTAPNLSYWYIITDSDDNILDWVNSTNGSTIDASGAPAGECHVWGWNYRGLDDPIVGENISTLSDDFCEDISDNFITVIRNEGGSSQGAVIVVNELNGSDEVEITNIGDESQDISSYWLCNFPAYTQISNLDIVCGDDLILEPGEFVTVNAGFDLDPADGEMGLYTTNSFGSSDAIISYVEWGSTGHVRSSTAVNAGVWTTGDFVAAFSDDNSIEYDGDGIEDSDWTEDAGSLCENNFTTSIGEVSYSIFPNPASETITLEFTQFTEQESSINIFDALGNRIESASHNMNDGATKTMNVSHYRGGAYFVRVTNGNANKVKRFIRVGN